ncbi:MAG: RDD family protein [Balneolaceae bacterium]|nr:RDD family protein [Balneolaceae bacterium]
MNRDRIDIETSQHVAISYKIAGVGERIFATILDFFFLGIYVTVMLLVISEWLGFDNFPAVFFMIILPVSLYHLVMEAAWDGQSLGKYLLRIKVIKLDGSQAGIGNFLVRWLFRPLEISATGGIMAILAILFNGKGQRIGDIAAGTCVIKIKGRVDLSDTVLTDLDDSYEPVFTQAGELTDRDMNIIRDLLSRDKRAYKNSTLFAMQLKAKNLIEERMGISSADMAPREFLETVLKDYNHLHR